MATQMELINKLGDYIEGQKYVLPTIPKNAVLILDLVNNPNSSVIEIESAASIEPIIASEILKVANSALYGSRMEINSLRYAIARIGFKQLRALIYSISIKVSLIKGKMLKELMTDIWLEALANAFFSKHLAQKVNENNEQAFLIGLMHNIGKLVILSVFQQASKDICKEMSLEKGLMEVIFNSYHLKMGAKFLDMWKISETISRVIQLQNEDSNLTILSRRELLLVHILQFSRSMCQMVKEKEKDDVDIEFLKTRMAFLPSSCEVSKLIEECQQVWDDVKKLQ